MEPGEVSSLCASTRPVADKREVGESLPFCAVAISKLQQGNPVRRCTGSESEFMALHDSAPDAESQDLLIRLCSRLCPPCESCLLLVGQVAWHPGRARRIVEYQRFVCGFILLPLTIENPFTRVATS